MSDSFPLPPMHILIADDNEANCLIARKILERLNHRVVTATHGLHAVKLAQTTEYDLIILDVLMPIMDGLTALQSIRTKVGKNKNTPIFALAAYCDADDRLRYSKAGFDAVLSKPLRHGHLNAAIRKVKVQGSKPYKVELVSAKSAQIPLLDNQTISLLLNLGDQNRLNQMQARFWLSIQKKCKVIEASLPKTLAGDPPQLSEFRRAVHAIKGASASIGLVRVVHIARGLRNAPPKDIPPLMAEFLQALQASRPELEKALAGAREFDTAV